VKLDGEIDSFLELAFWDPSVLFLRLTTHGPCLVLYLFFVEKQTDHGFSFVLAHVSAEGSLVFFFLLPSPLGTNVL
jgi:hypothetical protein